MVVARVVLKGEGGNSLLDCPPGADPERLSAYLPSEERVRDVHAWFERHGFDVGDAAVTGLSVEAPKERFETVFATSLESVHKDTEVAGHPGRTSEYYRSVGPLRIPQELTDLVAAVVLAEPPDFFP